MMHNQWTRRGERETAPADETRPSTEALMFARSPDPRAVACGPNDIKLGL
jgi:hypothetical protein